MSASSPRPPRQPRRRRRSPAAAKATVRAPTSDATKWRRATNASARVRAILSATALSTCTAAFAAAGLLRRRRGCRGGRGEDALIVVIGNDPLTAFALAARLIEQRHALGLRLVRESTAAARLLSRR